MPKPGEDGGGMALGSEIDPIPSAGGGGDDALESSLRDSFKAAGVEPDQPAEIPDEPEVQDPEGDGKTKPPAGSKPAAEKPDAKEKVVPPVDPKTATGKPAAPKTGAVDPESIKAPKLSKEGLEGWNALKETAKKNHALVQEREAEVQKLQKVIADKAEATKVETEKLQAELKELRGYRASFDHQFDPDFQKQFGEPMKKLESDMTKMLKNIGVTEEVIKTLKWNDEAQMARVANSIEENVNAISADRFRSRVKDFIELHEKKGEFLEEYKVKHEEFKTQKAQEIQQRTVESKSVGLKHVNELVSEKGEDGNFKIPFLLKFDPNPEATPDQIKAIEAHNAKADEYRQRLDAALNSEDPKDRAEIAIAAVASRFINERLQAALKQNASLQKELEKYNKVSTEKGLPGEGTPRAKVNPEMNADEALSAAFPNMR